FSFLSLAEPTLSEPPWRRGVAGPGGPAPSLGLLENLDHAPPLGGGQRPGLHQEHAVADPAGVVLVVGLVLLGTADDLAVQRVLDAVLDGDHNGPVYLVADHHALAGLAVAPRPRGLLGHCATRGRLRSLAHSLSSFSILTIPSSRSRITV